MLRLAVINFPALDAHDHILGMLITFNPRKDACQFAPREFIYFADLKNLEAATPGIFELPQFEVDLGDLLQFSHRGNVVCAHKMAAR